MNEIDIRRDYEGEKKYKFSPRVRILVPTYLDSVMRKSELCSSEDKDWKKEIWSGWCFNQKRLETDLNDVETKKRLYNHECINPKIKGVNHRGLSQEGSVLTIKVCPKKERG